MKFAVRAGIRRGTIELRQSVTNAGDLVSHFLWPTLLLVALYFLRHRAVGGYPLAAVALPGILGMNTAMVMVSFAQQLTADREDGTLLRARTIPHGIAGYLAGKLVSVSAGLLLDLAIFLLPGLLLVPGLRVGDPAAWLTIGWVLPLGLAATIPLGAVLGSAFGTARAQGLLTLPVLALIGISGVFYPLSALPAWLRAVAESFPIYWLGLGMRSALLPAQAVTLEVGGAWRHTTTVLVLLAWAIGGLIAAPGLLRRMARRESGAALAARRDRQLQRTG